MKRANTVTVLSLLAIVACGGSGDSGATGPVNAAVAGTWTGAVQSSSFPDLSVPISVTLSQNGTNVTGTFSCNSFACISASGTVTATVSGLKFTSSIAFPNGGKLRDVQWHGFC